MLYPLLKIYSWKNRTVLKVKDAVRITLVTSAALVLARESLVGASMSWCIQRPSKEKSHFSGMCEFGVPGYTQETANT
jgi:hypothetical protein